LCFGSGARPPPDGYTLLLAPNSFAVDVSLYDKVPYDPFRNFEPVAELTYFPVTFTVRPELAWARSRS
jgi:tripartite-type tricarboxylate transporter receptor subunit TctC